MLRDPPPGRTRSAARASSSTAHSRRRRRRDRAAARDRLRTSRSASTCPRSPTASRGRRFEQPRRARTAVAVAEASRARSGCSRRSPTQPEAQRVSSARRGRHARAGIADFTHKLFCHNFTADPGTVPIITTYFLHAALGGCPTASEIHAYMPLFEQRINAVIQWTGNRPGRVPARARRDRLRRAVSSAHRRAAAHGRPRCATRSTSFATLPHAVVYVEAGYSDANGPGYTARVLNAIDIRPHPGLLHERHARELDDQRDQVGRAGLEA